MIANTKTDGNSLDKIDTDDLNEDSDDIEEQDDVVDMYHVNVGVPAVYTIKDYVSFIASTSVAP